MRLQSLIPLFVSRIFAQTPPPAPGFTYLYTSNVTLSTAIANGVGSNGPRVTIPIIGGTVEGPRLNGK